MGAVMTARRSSTTLPMLAILSALGLLICVASQGRAQQAAPTSDSQVASPSQPFQTHLTTVWGEGVTAENAWREYPRPQMRRDNWTNLNGHWDYAVTSIAQQEAPDKWDGQILVPFCLESRLGGVQRRLDASEALWYRRALSGPSRPGVRVMLNFEAVDYRCQAYVNGTLVGEHQGGNTPFSFDVTDALRGQSNELVVRVEDETEGFQLRGKQTLNPRGIWYTQVSGIWQTVWTEEAPANAIEGLKISSDAAAGTITVRPQTASAARVHVKALDGERIVAEGDVEQGQVALRPDAPKLWTPSAPHLYDLEVALLDEQGEIVDLVKSYAGIRTVGKVRDASGNWRFTLNGDTLFHWGTLDQGWWPDGLLTPPSDEAMAYDVQWLKDAGFNMIRKHIKVEPRRYYYHCDRIGMMVWQDQVSGGARPPWTRLDPNPTDADWTDGNHQQFMDEFEEMVDDLEFHPSIVVWTPYNEAWGHHRTVEVGKWIAKRDPSRIVNIASGGNFWPVGDVVDHHAYPHPEFPFNEERYHDYVKVVGEFGGHGWPVKGHLWDTQRDNWGYGGLPKNADEYRERYEESLRRLNSLRQQGIAAGVYTQTTDVEGEINGLMTYDRKVVKIPAKELHQLHQVLFTN
ncbi:MAG: hypothetical protein KDA61_02045 [Planctomycetales bacterium]|nr:hypothetical protein [Planctomycetales bacterium]